MSERSFYSITESLKSGIDFYGLPTPQIKIFIEIDSNLSATTSKVSFASVSITTQSFTAFLGREILFASASISSSVFVSSDSLKISIAESDISSNVTSSISVNKIAFSNSSINGNSNVVSNGTLESFGSSSISGNSNVIIALTRIRLIDLSSSGEISVTISGTKIQQVSANINAFTILVALAQQTALASTNISISSSIISYCIKFAVNDVPDTSSYRTLFIIDDKPLTNQGRTHNSDQSMVVVENKNWNSKKTRYYKRSNSAGRNSFVLSWSFLPNSRYDTIDRRYARDYIKELASDPDVHTLKVINNDFNQEDPYTETSYNVFIKDYSETLIRRDLQNDVYYWDCSLTLEEV